MTDNICPIKLDYIFALNSIFIDTNFLVYEIEKLNLEIQHRGQIPLYD